MLTNPPRQIFSLYELWDSIIHEPIRDGFSCRLFLYLYWVIMLRSLHVCMTVGGRIRLVYLISSLVSLPQIVCRNPFISASISFAARRARAAATGSQKIRWRRVTHHTQTLPRQRGPVPLPLLPPSPKLSISQWVTEAARTSLRRSHTLNLSDVSAPDEIQTLQTVPLMPVSIVQIQASRWILGWNNLNNTPPPSSLQDSDVACTMSDLMFQMFLLNDRRSE